MKIKSIISFLMAYWLLLLLSSSMLASPCPPPDCGDCYTWDPNIEECVWDCTTGECCDDGTCVTTCPGCKSCSSGVCEDDESKCPGECDTCDDGTCTDHDYECNWRLCETCIDGECEDECPALGKHCNYDTGMCEVCVDDFHCELCEHCNVLHECVHPCDDCDPPKYCGYACFCVECYYGEEDTTTCSTSHTPAWGECDCSHNIISPCGGTKETIIYSGNPLKSCTGDDCEIRDVLCYTTYDGCEVSGSYKPLLWCKANATGPPTCQIVLEFAGPGCYDCVHDPETGLRTNADSGVCPTEDWPDE